MAMLLGLFMVSILHNVVHLLGLAGSGARPQRPLWASTGVKSPDYPDTTYVSELAIAETVNTMPGAMPEAFADHGDVPATALVESYPAAQDVLDELANLGVDLDEITDELETQGVGKFVASWDELAGTVRDQIHREPAG